MPTPKHGRRLRPKRIESDRDRRQEPRRLRLDHPARTARKLLMKGKLPLEQLGKLLKGSPLDNLNVELKTIAPILEKAVRDKTKLAKTFLQFNQRRSARSWVESLDRFGPYKKQHLVIKPDQQDRLYLSSELVAFLKKKSKRCSWNGTRIIFLTDTYE